MVTLSYVGTAKNPVPIIEFFHPTYHNCKVYYTSPTEASQAYCEYELDPLETQDGIFYLNPAAPVIRSDRILITAMGWDTVNIVPSSSEIEFDSMSDSYVATARLVNLSNK